MFSSIKDDIVTQNPYDNATSGGYAPRQVPGQRLVAMEEEPEEKKEKKKSKFFSSLKSFFNNIVTDDE